MATPNRARVYTHVNATQPSEYWDYEAFSIVWGNQDDYQLVRRLSSGKFSDVFQAINVTSGQCCAAKVLKSVKRRRVKREVRILENLQGGPNIVPILDIVRDPMTKTPTLIFEFLTTTTLGDIQATLEDSEIRYYLYELLRALDFTHSKGIMHRDIKPQNVIIHQSKRQLLLIDWSLADFYHANQKYNVHVASRYFKSPELLLGYGSYDYSIDMWSFGCIVASIVFGMESCFQGSDDFEQLVSIANVLGTEDLLAYINKYRIVVVPQTKSILDHTCESRPWANFLEKQNKPTTADALDLIDKILQYDHFERLSAKEGMAHRYFEKVTRSEKTKIVEGDCSATKSTPPTDSSFLRKSTNFDVRPSSSFACRKRK